MMSNPPVYNAPISFNKAKTILLLTGFVTITTILIVLTQLYNFTDNASLYTAVSFVFIIVGLFLGIYFAIPPKKNVAKALCWQFIIVAILISFLLAPLFVNGLFFYGRGWTNGNLWLPCLLFSISLSVILFFLSRIIQQTLFSKGLLFFGLGVLVGLLLVTIMLLGYLSIASAIFICICALLVAAAILLHDYAHEIVTLSLVIAVGLIGYGTTIKAQNFNYRQQVAKPAPVSIANILPHYYQANMTYSGLLKQILFQDLKLKDKNILILGDANLFLSQADTHHNHFTYMNVHANQLPSACTYLGMVAAGDVIYQGFNKMALHRKYDVVISTVDGEQSLHMNAITQVLAKDGVAVFNVIANPGLTNQFSKPMDHTIHKAFSHCLSIPLQYSNKSDHLVYVCRV